MKMPSLDFDVIIKYPQLAELYVYRNMEEMSKCFWCFYAHDLFNLNLVCLQFFITLMPFIDFVNSCKKYCLYDKPQKLNIKSENE